MSQLPYTVIDVDPTSNMAATPRHTQIDYRRQLRTTIILNPNKKYRYWQNNIVKKSMLSGFNTALKLYFIASVTALGWPELPLPELQSL